MQALLELQRQQDSTRLSTTRDLTRRLSSSQIPPLPPSSADGDAVPVHVEHLRPQSQSFTGMHLALGEQSCEGARDWNDSHPRNLLIAVRVAMVAMMKRPMPHNCHVPHGPLLAASWPQLSHS